MFTIIGAIFRFQTLRRAWEWFQGTTWYMGAHMWYDGLSTETRAAVLGVLIMLVVMLLFVV